MGTLNLNIQLDVSGKPRGRKITGSNQCLRTDYLKLCVGDIRLGMELVLVVDAAFDLA
jgi:hypothetical protein